MSVPPSHPLLRLVDANKNTLKCALVKYIDVTVEQQFGQLRNRIVHMVESGEIVLGNVNAIESTQANDTQVNASNQQSTSDTFPCSSLSTITTPQLIKQKCLEDWSSTIPINVQCNDAPNDEDKEQSNNADIEVNHAQNEQVPIDEVKEEYESDDGDECEDWVNGICQLNQSHLVRENDHTDNVTPNDIDNDHLENIGISLVQGDLSTEQITCPLTNQCQTSTLQSNSKLSNHIEDEVGDFDVCLNGIEEEDDETNDEQILINQNDEESRLPAKRERLDQTQPPNEQLQVKGQCPIETTPVNSQIECEELVIQQSIPSTSGLQSSGKKRRPMKMSGDVQTNGQVKSDKRKSMTQSSKAVKKVKAKNGEEIDEESGEDKGEKETEPKIVTLELNCTETGCNSVFRSLEGWKGHVWMSHRKSAFKHLYDNVRRNQHGQTEYPCTECDVVCKQFPVYISYHWQEFHQSGKFQCSACDFVANLWCEVEYHIQKNHIQKKHPSRKFQCTHPGCNRAFTSTKNLQEHVPVHSNERPFVCIWDNCQATLKRHKTALRHVRTQHFRLPPTVREQNKQNIIDERDPKEFVQVLRG